MDTTVFTYSYSRVKLFIIFIFNSYYSIISGHFFGILVMKTSNNHLWLPVNTEIRAATDLYDMTTTAREVMRDELQSRMFDNRPSNMRLVQCYMSKQTDAKELLTANQYRLAQTLYLTALREAMPVAKKSGIIRGAVDQGGYMCSFLLSNTAQMGAV